MTTLKSPYILIQRNYQDPRHQFAFEEMSRLLKGHGITLVVVYTHSADFDGRLWASRSANDVVEIALEYKTLGRVVWFDWRKFSELCAGASLVLFLDDMPTNILLTYLLKTGKIGSVPYLFECGHVNDLRGGMKEWARRWFSRWLYGREEGVLTFSVKSSEYLRSLGVDSNILYETYSTDIRGYIDPALPDYQYDKAAPVRFCFLGYMSERKGAALLHSCFENFISRNPDQEVEFHIIGPEVEFSQLPQGILHNHGYLDDTKTIATALRGMDYLLLPSFREPWGHVVIEAATLGLPSIVSDHVGSAMLHKAIGADALCVPPQVDALGAALENALYLRQDRSAYLALRQDFADAAVNYGHPQRAAKVVDIFLRVIAGAGSNARPTALAS